MLGMILREFMGGGGRRSLPPPAIIRRIPGRLSLASWTPPELASVSPVDDIMLARLGEAVGGDVSAYDALLQRSIWLRVDKDRKRS